MSSSVGSVGVGDTRISPPLFAEEHVVNQATTQNQQADSKRKHYPDQILTPPQAVNGVRKDHWPVVTRSRQSSSGHVAADRVELFVNANDELVKQAIGEGAVVGAVDGWNDGAFGMKHVGHSGHNFGRIIRLSRNDSGHWQKTRGVPMGVQFQRLLEVPVFVSESGQLHGASTVFLPLVPPETVGIRFVADVSPFVC